MVSMLDCIKRVPLILDAIIEKRDAAFQGALDICADSLTRLNEVVFIGSGTSSTSCITARYLAERLSGLRITTAIPSEFLYSQTYFNPDALYVFVSQTGTSTLTRKALAFAKGKGFMTAAMSESPDTPIAKEAGAFIDMGCGYEEYPMRTIGYSSTALTLILLCMQIGINRGALSLGEAESYVAQAKAASANILSVIDKSMAWLDKNRRKMLRSDCLVFSGSGSLYGVALEGAVKVWETPQIISMGYELEEGLHGPNFGYSHRHCLISLNDGGIESSKAIAIGKYMKNEKQNGFIVGAGAVDGEDFGFEPLGGVFSFLEFAAVVQVISYRLAEEQGRDLYAPHDNSAMYSYFQSHDNS